MVSHKETTWLHIICAKSPTRTVFYPGSSQKHVYRALRRTYQNLVLAGEAEKFKTQPTRCTFLLFLSTRLKKVQGFGCVRQKQVVGPKFEGLNSTQEVEEVGSCFRIYGLVYEFVEISSGELPCRLSWVEQESWCASFGGIQTSEASGRMLWSPGSAPSYSGDLALAPTLTASSRSRSNNYPDVSHLRGMIFN